MSVDGSLGRLITLLRRCKALDMHRLQGASGGRSRRSLFRDLARVGYLSSYTHAGRYYTLKEIPVFDEHGLWFYQGIGFSHAGTLKATVNPRHGFVLPDPIANMLWQERVRWR